MATERPLVSVLVLTRDRLEPLVRCLKSVADQDYGRTEVIVLDDYSTRTDLAEMVQQELPGPVQFIRSDTHLGVAGGRNALMDRATGDVLVFIDDDAFFHDSQDLSRIVACLDEHPKVGIVAIKVIDHRPNGATALLVPFTKAAWRRHPDLVDQARLVSYYVGTCHAIRKTVVERCGGYQGDLVYGEEESFYSYRAVELGIELMYLPEAVIHHHPERSVLPGATARDDRELFYHVRNRIWLAYRFLPLPYALSFLAVWGGYYGVQAMRRRLLKRYVEGIAKGLVGCRRLSRRPLGGAAVRYHKANHGRLWY